MDYEHDIFVSYRRTPNIGRWVIKHLLPTLRWRLEEVAPRPVRIFCDETSLDEGDNLPEALKHHIRHSAILLAVWDASYFRSAWCMAEWQSFCKRAGTLGMFSETQHRGLVYPVRYADGEYFHPDAKMVVCRKDFSKLNYPHDSFRESTKYLEFDDLIQQVAEELILHLGDIPPWDPTFPIIESPPISPPTLHRPMI